MSADVFAMVRAFNRMRHAGFEIRIANGRLQVAPAENLTDEQSAFLRSHKDALVGLLTDAEALAALLDAAGRAGLGWREGTDWDDRRLLATGEVLYGQKRMVSVLGRRYNAAVAPSIPDFKEVSTLREDAPTEAQAA